MKSPRSCSEFVAGRVRLGEAKLRRVKTPWLSVISVTQSAGTTAPRVGMFPIRQAEEQLGYW